METLIYFLLWAALFVVMMRFGCGAHVMGHGHKSHGGHGTDTGAADRLPAPPEKAVDPVCGMTVETAAAKSSLHAGKAYYFCSPECRTKFEAAPERFLAVGEPQPQQQMEHHHG